MFHFIAQSLEGNWLAKPQRLQSRYFVRMVIPVELADYHHTAKSQPRAFLMGVTRSGSTVQPRG